MLVYETRTSKNMMIEVKGSTNCLNVLGGSPKGAHKDEYNAM
jgi:hypothetical protein